LSLSHFKDFSITGITCCVPQSVEKNIELPFDPAYLQRVISSTGINERRKVSEAETAGDLCYLAAKSLMANKDIKPSEISVLVFVTNFPDYFLPSTAHIIKKKLDLSQECLAVQINEGCSGYLYGLQVLLSLLQSTNGHKGLLLAGDTTTKVISNDDAGTLPLFGDAGSATIIEKVRSDIFIKLGSDAEGFEDIIVRGGGFRHQKQEARLEMNGMNVFSFGINKVPKIITDFLNELGLTPKIDFIALHQANQLMLDRIIKKLGIQSATVLMSLEKYGNTSSASIPLSITIGLVEDGLSKEQTFLTCGFGVGLSWATAYFSLGESCHFDVIESTL
jgi:3-oxoacyl-[acyl-carrier-protein] synthase-3